MQRKRQKIEYVKNCVFCNEKKEPDFMEYTSLEKYISERGKIFSRSRTGLCAKHQRKITYEIKRARHLAFLPFIVSAE